MANVFSDISNFLSGGIQGNAVDFLTSAGKGVKDMTTPDLVKLIPQLQMQVQQGTMTPEQYQIITAVMQGKMDPAQATAAFQQDSQMNGVKTDAASIQGIRTALGQLNNIAENKGLTEADRAQFNALMDQSNANVAQQRAAQVQQLQMQGNAGTGTELAARLAGVQGTANSNALAGANIASSAQARALAAIQAGLQGNQNLNTNLFNQNAARASAQDAVNQFNTQAKNAVSLANAGMQQQANLANFNTANQIAMQNAAAGTTANATNAAARQAANLANFDMANKIAGTNTTIANQQAMLPMQATQQNFTNELNKQVNAGNLQNTAGKNLTDLAKTQQENTSKLLTAVNNGPVGEVLKDGYKWVKDSLGKISQVPTSTVTGNLPGTVPGGSGVDGVIANNPSGYINPSDAVDNAGTVTDLTNVGSEVPDVTDFSDAWDLFSDKDLKTDKKKLNDNDVDKMMAEMTAYKYRYKGAKSNPMQTGVMAQDMKNYGSVVDTPAGKVVQGPQAMGQALAILANQHERIKRLEGYK